MDVVNAWYTAKQTALFIIFLNGIVKIILSILGTYMLQIVKYVSKSC